MGIDLNLIVGSLGRTNCSCTICKELLDEAITLPCEHSFCRACIDGWIAVQMNKPCCPYCRGSFSADHDVKSPVLFMRNMMSEIKLKCPFGTCGIIVDYDDFKSHQHECRASPIETVTCWFCDNEHLEMESVHQDTCFKYIKFKLAILELQATKEEGS